MPGMSVHTLYGDVMQMRLTIVNHLLCISCDKVSRLALMKISKNDK